MALFAKTDRDPALREQRDHETKFAKATATRDSLSERLRVAEAAISEHRDLARKLATDGADDVALTKAENAMRAQEDRAVTLRAAIVDAESVIATHEREIAEIIDRRMRAETSAAVETMADQLQIASEDFENVAKALEDAARESSLIVLDGHPLTSFVMSARQQLPAAIAVITRELRNHSHAVLSGGAPASLPRHALEPKLTLIEAPKMTEIVALRNVKYVDARGVTVCVGKLQRHSMPAALADEAMRSGAVCAVVDPRVRDQIGNWGMVLPSADRCEWIGPPAKAEPAPTTYRPPIPHSTLGQFEVVDRGPPLVGTMPVRPSIEPAGASRKLSGE
jgi:hypothetical protein